jgi:hypothetical protein
MKKITIIFTKLYFNITIKVANFYYKIRLNVGIMQQIIDEQSGKSSVASQYLLPSILLLVMCLTTLSVVDYVTEETSVEKQYLSLKEAQKASEKLGFGITAQDKTGEYIDSSEIHAERIIQELAEQNLREQEIQSVIMYAESGATEDELRAYIRVHTLIDSSEKLIAAMKLRAETRAAPPPATSPAPRSAPVVIGKDRVQAAVVATPAPPVTVTPPKRQAPTPPKPAVVTPTPTEVVVVTTEMPKNFESAFPDHYFYYGRNNLVGRSRAELYEIYTRVYKEDPSVSISDMKTALLFWYYQNFIELVANEVGVRPAVIAAMFRIEAIRPNGGETDLAAINNNCGGIKHRNGLPGKKVYYKDDCYNEDNEPILCNFAGYNSPEEGARAWALIISAARYRPAIEADKNKAPYATVFRYFKNGGYWTAQGSGPVNSRAKYARLYEYFLSQRK